MLTTVHNLWIQLVVKELLSSLMIPSSVVSKHFCDHRNGKKYAAIRALRVNLALLVQPIDAQLPSPPTAAISSTAVSTAKRSS